MKVYCKDCTWRTVGSLACCPVTRREDDYLSPRHKIYSPLEWGMERNKNNNCPYYKRKWWKIWLTQ